MQYQTNNGVVVIPSRKFHEHSQVTDSLLKVAISNESKAIENAFKNGQKIAITHSFPMLIGVSHCVPCPPHSPGVYFKRRGDRPYLSRMVKGKPIDTNQLTFVLYPQTDRMTLITAWVGGQSCPEIGNINRFEDEDNPVEKMKESVDFWMNHALIEE